MWPLQELELVCACPVWDAIFRRSRVNPVAIFRYSQTEGPGYFATYLSARRIPWQQIKIDEGEAVSASPEGFSCLCGMGGPIIVNDDLPWIPKVLSLIRHAVAADVQPAGGCCPCGVEPLLRQPDFRPGKTSGHAVPCGDDGGTDSCVVPGLGKGTG